MCFDVQPAAYAGSKYAPGLAADNALQSNAINLASLSPPKTYQFDPVAANKSAAQLSRVSTVQNQDALKQRSPEAYAGQEAAIKTISGGVPGDDQFLRNEALKSGLEAGVNNGSIGANSVTSPTSVGGVTAGNIFGKELLNYRNSRANQALGLAGSLQPDASVNPSSALSMEIGSQKDAVNNSNSFQNFLNQARFGQAQSLESQTQQALGENQAYNNSQADAINASSAAKLQAATQVLSSLLSSGSKMAMMGA